ncbi:TPA: hypothetical protein NJ081_002905 [Vibrio parahaemolyticus]|nr:hypothetical protein [Vibrio parahaemolyticus]
MNYFKRIIYLTLIFAFIKVVVLYKYGTARVLNDVIPIMLIALILIVSYWVVIFYKRLFGKQCQRVDVQIDREWDVIKKYVPEVNHSLNTIRSQLDNDVDLAEEKLKELFSALGKEGLTDNAIEIIVADVKKISAGEIGKGVRVEVQKEPIEFDAFLFKFIGVLILILLVFVFFSAS